MIRVVDCQLISRQLYKSGVDGILCTCVLEHEQEKILYEEHGRIVRGHNAGKAMRRKVLHGSLWWPSFFQDAQEYCNWFLEIFYSPRFSVNTNNSFLLSSFSISLVG